jgi:hypothetical protein
MPETTDVLAGRCPGRHNDGVTFGARFRRLLHLVVVLAAAALVALPMLAGPGATGLVRALGGSAEHHCACGMAPGTCGCPDCAQLEQEKKDTNERLAGHAVLRSSCDDGSGLPGIDAAPPGAVPFLAMLPRPAFESLRAEPTIEVDRSRLRARPPTPPPRSLV